MRRHAAWRGHLRGRWVICVIDDRGVLGDSTSLLDRFLPELTKKVSLK